MEVFVCVHVTVLTGEIWPWTLCLVGLLSKVKKNGRERVILFFYFFLMVSGFLDNSFVIKNKVVSGVI